MAKDRSPYEGLMDNLGGKTCLGQVVSVDASNRTVRCRTMGNQAHGTDDQDLQTVKILHSQWHPDGTYAISMPLVGAYHLIHYLNSEPLLGLAYPLSNTENGGLRDNQTDDLAPGDYALVTAAGSRLVIRSGGTVEIESTKGCRTYWLPTYETITTVCQNHELYTAGGTSAWTVDPDTGETTLNLQAFSDNTAGPASGAVVQIGTTDSGATIDVAVGAPDESLTLTQKNFSLQIMPDGTTKVDVGPGKVTITITPDGKLDITTTADATMTVGGKATINATGDASVIAGGDCNVTASGNINAKGAKIMLNGSASGVTTANSHMNVIDLITGAPVQPSTTVFADV